MLVIMMHHTTHTAADQVIPKSDDIGRLTELLSDAATKSFELGMLLGISNGQLKKIERDYGTSVRRMSEVLTTWVEGTENPTVGKLVDALRSDTINELVCARKVSEMYTVHL